jgi:hypothetical protein
MTTRKALSNDLSKFNEFHSGMQIDLRKMHILTY